MPLSHQEALAALVSLPSVSRIASVPAASDDVIVVECQGILSQAAIHSIEEQLGRVWPDRKIVILDQGARIKVAPA